MDLISVIAWVQKDILIFSTIQPFWIMLVEALEVETVSSSLKQPKNSTGKKKKKLPVDIIRQFLFASISCFRKKKMPKENVNASKIQRLSFKNLTQFEKNKIFTALTVDSIMQAITKW